MRCFKFYSIVFIYLIIAQTSMAQSFGIGTDSPDPQAIMELQSTNQGFLAPRMTTAQRNAIGVALGQDDGLLIYNLSTDQFNYWDGTQWVAMPDLSADDDWTRGSGVMYPSNIGDNVGIGTNTPSDRLVVEGGRVEISNNYFATGTQGTGSLEIANSLRLSAIDIATNTNGILYMQYNNNADLDVDNGTLRVDASTNNVGIGDFTPTNKLDIYHNSSTTNSHIRLQEIGTDYARLTFSNTTYPAAYWTVAGLGNTTSANAALNFYFDNGASGNNWLTIQGNGRVEMPYSGDANGTAGTGVLEIANSLRIDGNEIITNTNSTLYIQADNNGDLDVDGSTLRVDASADYVGIGDATPNAKLDVETFTTAQAIYAYSSAGEGARIRGDAVDPVGGWWFCLGSGAVACGGNETNFAGPAGVVAGGRSVGVLGVAEVDASTTTDHSGGLFVSKTSSNGVRAISAVAADINGTIFKVVGYGTVSTLVEDEDNKLRIMHAPETPEALFQDYGQGKLVNGEAYIKLDPIFSKNIVVDAKHPLRVFIQLKGDCKGTYVTSETEKGFKVKELMGGRSNVAFNWTVTANRRDQMIDGQISKYQDLRFEPMRDPMHKYEYPKDESIEPTPNSINP